MYFSLGGGNRAIVGAAVILVSLSLSACSSDEPAPLKQPTTATTDAEAANAVAVYKKYWAAVESAQNVGKVEAGQFDGIADGPIVERFINRVSGDADNGIKRVGRPELSDYEATVDGDSATVLVCLNQDKWTFEFNGEPIKQEKSGTEPVGAKATQRDGGWIITEQLVSADLTKECS